MSTPSFMKALSFLRPRSVSHPVQGTEIEFFAFSPKVLWQLRQITEPLAKALSTLFGTGDRAAQGNVYEQFEEGDEKVVRNSTPALTAEAIKANNALRIEAISQLMEALLSDGNRQLIGNILADSMREVFERPVKESEVKEFLDSDSIDAGILIEMLAGVWKANKEVFAPLLPTASSNFRGEIARVVRGHLGLAEDEVLSQDEDETESQRKPVLAIPGDDLKTE